MMAFEALLGAASRRRALQAHFPRSYTVRQLVLALVLVASAFEAPVAQRSGAAAPRQDSSFARAPRRGYVPKTSRADSLRGAIDSPGRRWWKIGRAHV